MVAMAYTANLQNKLTEGNLMSASDDLTIKDVAERLGVSRRTVNRMINRGQLPNAHKRNPFASRRAEWYIPESDVIAVEKMVDEFKSSNS